jgi:hypothetical protein
MSEHFVNVKFVPFTFGWSSDSYTIKLNNKQFIAPYKSRECNILLHEIFQKDSNDIYKDVYNPKINNQKYPITEAQFTTLYTKCLLYD